MHVCETRSLFGWVFQGSYRNLLRACIKAHEEYFGISSDPCSHTILIFKMRFLKYVGIPGVPIDPFVASLGITRGPWDTLLDFLGSYSGIRSGRIDSGLECLGSLLSDQSTNQGASLLDELLGLC